MPFFFWSPSGVVAGLASSSDFIGRAGAMLHGFEGKSICLGRWHAYAFDVVLKKSREHVFWRAYN